MHEPVAHQVQRSPWRAPQRRRGLRSAWWRRAGLQVEEKDLTDTREPRPDGGGWWIHSHTWALVFWVVRTACAKALRGNLPGMPER